MVAAAEPMAPVRPGVGEIERRTIDQLARWLLFVVALDLVLTRFLVRLAIFVPKDGPFATVAAALGRVGAAVDVLVPIVAGILLGALLLRAGRAGGAIERASLVGVMVVAVGGLALVVVSPAPMVVAVLGLLVGVVAIIAGLRLAANDAIPSGARIGLGLLAAAVACAAIAPALDASGIAATGGLAGTGDVARPDGVSGLSLMIIGQLAYLAGAITVGLAGVLGAGRHGGLDRRTVSLAVLVATVLLAAATAAPSTWAALAIWSVGLSGVIPGYVAAIALGLVVAGLPAFHRQASTAAIGAAIVLLAGYGLAASGLVVASLLGLVVAGLPQLPGPASPDPHVVR